ncbi:MAG: flagellar biosynthesis anti-sigma factor FlgM [Phycisphaerales bacterium]|nr:MAG: flagellar biosynthesis anti-sigma factor FlgM [Phycisphaerales bacterium]
MSNSDPKRQLEGREQDVELVGERLLIDDDLAMEQILENISHTPIGKVLKSIASLPEIRREKVLDLRQQLTEGRYNVSERLDVALDKVLEDITA